MHPDECLLRDVHGLVRVLHHSQGKLDDAAVVTLHERAERLLVAPLRRPDQCPIVLGLLGTFAHSDALGRQIQDKIPGVAQGTKRNEGRQRGLGGNPGKANLV